jgi:hypothetical protein
MQELLTYNHSIKKFVGKILTYHEEKHVQTLVVNLPQEKCHNMPRKASHQQVRLNFKDQIPNKGAKIRPHKCE